MIPIPESLLPARAAVVVPVAVLALVAVALATAYWWRRKGRESPPGSAKAGDVEASMSDKPGERYGSGMGPFPGARPLCCWRPPRRVVR